MSTTLRLTDGEFRIFTGCVGDPPHDIYIRTGLVTIALKTSDALALANALLAECASQHPAASAVVDARSTVDGAAGSTSSDRSESA